jgi:dolichyl-phosphate-mannose-protein mannosyltransferase
MLKGRRVKNDDNFRLEPKLDRIMARAGSKAFWQAVAVFLISHLIFLAGISSPSKLYGDEVHYIPAARHIIARDQILIREHPPLAKTLMATSIVAWGDNSLGWRYMSALFGSLALTGMYVWALYLFRNESAALWAVAITFVNQFLYVQSRIATLDVFVVAFTIWAMALFTATWNSSRVKGTFMTIGVMLGLAIASKWTGLIALMMIAGTVTVAKVLQNWRTVFENPNETDWYRPDLWGNMRISDWIVSLVIIPLVVYFITFVPVYGADPVALILLQKEMWDSLWRVTTPHPYMSSWVNWALLRRPILYLFGQDRENGNSLGVVMFLGNPVVLWSGVIALFACTYDWLKTRRRDAFVISMSWVTFYFTWALVRRPVSFCYYYFPAGMVLSLSLTYVFYQTGMVRAAWTRYIFLCLAIGAFIYFLPISSAVVGVTDAGYARRMWFGTWPVAGG